MASNLYRADVGLSLVKQLVERQGGHINFKSVEGEGSTFTVVLLIEPRHHVTQLKESPSLL
ncbi:MAG: hypothetical protein COB46_09645 [Rhodospirillaceae bacterium]|nr:MAG: hypothetical protein COB46_09645 [Rhodospirillaceae bacterium]